MWKGKCTCVGAKHDNTPANPVAAAKVREVVASGVESVDSRVGEIGHWIRAMTGNKYTASRTVGRILIRII